MKKKNEIATKLDPVMEFIFDRCEVNKEILHYLLSLLPAETSSRMIMAMAGIHNPIAMIDALPLMSRMNDNTDYCDYGPCFLDSFNYLEDHVHYTYHKTCYRIFKKQEDAEKFSKNGDYDWRGESSKQGRTTTDEFPFLGVFERDDVSYTCYDNWVKNAIIDE